MRNQNDWHGISIPGVGTIHIGPLPDRKAIALYTIQGSQMHVMAYFRNATEARRALKFLDAAFSINNTEWSAVLGTSRV